MYDTVSFRTATSSTILRKVQGLDLQERLSNRTGLPFWRGDFQGMHIHCSQGQLLASLSLAKVGREHNQHCLTIAEASNAIDWVAETLGCSPDRCQIGRLDIAADFKMDLAAIEYINSMDTIRGLGSRRFMQGPNSEIIFQNKQEEVVFYTKGPQMQEYFGEGDPHLLRYELRLFNNSARQLRVKSVSLNQLAEPQIYHRCAEKWAAEYRRLKFRKVLCLSAPLAARGVRGARSYLAAVGLSQVGEEAINQTLFLECPGATHRTKRGRIVKMLRSLSDHRILTDSELSIELSDKVAARMAWVHEQVRTNVIGEI